MSDHPTPVDDPLPAPKSNLTSARLLAILVVVCLLIGGYLLSQTQSSVRGTVTLDGKPLTTGLVSFHPTKDGPIAYGRLDANGHYELRTGGSGGLTSGDYRVTIAASDEQAPAVRVEGGGSPIQPLLTPARYADKETSGLTAHVAWGANTLDFAIDSP